MNDKYKLLIWVSFLVMVLNGTSWAQPGLWHGKERVLHYQPAGNGFKLHKGARKFNRALYGGNTAFRVEAGDLPEFSMYLPGMGGNLQLFLKRNNQRFNIADAASVTALYKDGTMQYTIRDSRYLKNGLLNITVLALHEVEGMMVKATGINLPAGTYLEMVYGGVSGKKFSRNGDIGADPESSFYLKSENCTDNIYTIDNNQFALQYGKSKEQITGQFPAGTVLKTENIAANAPVLQSSAILQSGGSYIIRIQKGTGGNKNLQQQYDQALMGVQQLANRIVLETPDPWINPMATALALAADGIFEDPAFLHGAVAWRMFLPAWRGAYAADPLGWQDRARSHFDSYLQSQVTNIAPGKVIADTALHITRQEEKWGNAMFSNGYIGRNPGGVTKPHHYDMNLVFIDQLLNHFNYTGDLEYVKKVWPAIRLHLQWEKRNYDADGDGLYDAYACIWASDGLQYSGGGVAHSTAYNYRANRAAALIAGLLGEDGSVYKNEADKILRSVNNNLWIKDKGWLAEYRDASKYRHLHPYAGLWTIYHAIDAQLLTAEQQYQALRYVDHHIPHIPVKAAGLQDEGYQVLATTNWQPYTWSVNNVALAENLHTALAYWQANDSESAFRLWKSNLVESMYLGSSPGNFQQLSFYDAVRGELYRDFADPVGVAARTLTEGLFGILPDAQQGKLLIKPGFPKAWNFAKLATPIIQVEFKRNNNTDRYTIDQKSKKPLALQLRVKALRDKVISVTANGKPVKYDWVEDAIGEPVIEIEAGKLEQATITIVWGGAALVAPKTTIVATAQEAIAIDFNKASIVSINDPQQALQNEQHQHGVLKAIAASLGKKTFFVQVKQGAATWKIPVSMEVLPAVVITAANKLSATTWPVSIKNNSSKQLSGMVQVNGFSKAVNLAAHGVQSINVPVVHMIKGTNEIIFETDQQKVFHTSAINWDVASLTAGAYETVDVSSTYNANNAAIFQQKYMSPRPQSTTLQIPWQGIGNWCYPLIQPVIADMQQLQKEQVFLENIPFKISAANNNIAYTSLWDNFPDSIAVPVSGKASHAYFLMAGSTNHQQSQIVNAQIAIVYTDGSTATLPLVNPHNWVPIEQAFREDGYAFTTGAPAPYRFLFRNGSFARNILEFTDIKGFSTQGIAGGAGVVVDIPLNKHKELQSIKLKTMAEEVVAGLISVTLVR